MCEPNLGEMITSLGDHTTDSDRPFVGNHWFQDERGKTEVKGICFRDLADCIVKAFVDSVETNDELKKRSNDGTLNYNDLYTLDLSAIDPIALLLNVCCRVEKTMGIYPNIKKE